MADNKDADSVIERSEYTTPHTHISSAKTTISHKNSVNMHQFYPTICFPGDEEAEAIPSPRDEEWAAKNVARAAATKGETSAENAEVFSTQVDEEVIEGAKKRHRLILTEEASNHSDVISMEEMVWTKVHQQIEAALQLMSRDKHASAIRLLNKAMHLQPDNIELYVHRAEAFLRLTDFQSAILNYKRACVMDPNRTQYYNRLAFVYYFQGQCLYDQKLYPEALEAFSRATEMRPEVIGYHLRSIACLAALQRHGECLALINKQLEMEQENADLFIMRARLHRLFKNTTLSYYDVKDALAIDEDHPEAKRLMAVLQKHSIDLKDEAMKLNLLGRNRDALQKISLAIETNPSQAEFHILRGALHRRLGDFNSAIDDYLLALDKTDHDETNPLYMDTQRQLLLTYNDFAVECFTKNFFEEAIILLNKAIKGERAEKGLYINRGDCFFKDGNLQFALADYHQALELDPTDAMIHSRIAAIHNEHGLLNYQDKNYTEAESRFTLAIQHNPRMPKFYISRCKVRQVLENAAGAREDILFALHLDPLNTEVISMMSRLFPGKTANDVLHSPAAMEAKKAVEHLVVKASPVRLNNMSPDKKSSNKDFNNTPNSDETPPSPWKVGKCFPELKACMVEQDFHIKIAVEKKKINHKVQDALHHRPSLNFNSGRVQEMPKEMPRGKRTKKGNLVPMPPSEPKSKKSGGWRQFTSGIGVGN